MSISSIAPEPEKPKEGEQNSPLVEEAAPVAEALSTTPEAPPTTSSSVPAATEKNASATVTQVQEPAKTAAQQITDALLSRLAPVGKKANFKCLIYGPPGGGKSSFLGGAENNLIYDQEDGLISIKTSHHHSGRKPKNNIQAIPFTSFQQADLLLDRLAERIPELEQFDVFSVDTMNDFAKKAMAERLVEKHRQRPSSVDQYLAEVEDYSAINERVLRWVRRLRDLDRDVILLAHSKTVEPKGKPAKTYPDFSESLANKIEAMMDIVGYMEMQEIDGKSTPVLRVVSDGTVHAKTRIPLPEVILDPTYDGLRAEWSKHTDD